MGCLRSSWPLRAASVAFTSPLHCPVCHGNLQAQCEEVAAGGGPVMATYICPCFGSTERFPAALDTSEVAALTARSQRI